jgi:predicted N-acyltransferase
MADREAEILARLESGVAAVDPAQWDALTGGDPFLSHAFLSSLEDSVSVGPGTGWGPAPIVIEEEERLLAAAPAYLKSHSQGEYVFDHGWADAWERAGGQYYPKLQIAVPFTPVPGTRLLGARPQQLLAAAEAVTVQNDLSSAHVTFIDEDGASECERRLPGCAQQPQAQGHSQGTSCGARGA